MSSGLEGVGDAATGAIVAGALDAGPGGAGHGRAGQSGPAADGAHGACLNCGTILIGGYCHACGQSGHLHRTIGGFVHDIVHGVFHFEGRVWTTLPLLLVRPGELTRRYIAGERAKFVSPIALFLFCVFLMFAVVGSLAGSMHMPEVRAADRSRSLGDIETSLARNEAQMRSVRERIRTQERAGRDTAALAATLDDLEQDTEQLEIARGYVKTGRLTGGGQVTGVKTGWAALDKGVAAASDNPNLFLYRLQTSAYKYSWLLIPLSLPFVWLLFFWKKTYRFYDHLVFVTFSITFMLLLATALTMLGAVGVPGGMIALAAMLVPPLHIYRQVRGAYDSRRSTALVRTVALLLFGLMVLVMYLGILLALGIMK